MQLIKRAISILTITVMLVDKGREQLCLLYLSSKMMNTVIDELCAWHVILTWFSCSPRCSDLLYRNEVAKKYITLTNVLFKAKDISSQFQTNIPEF
jgi:hypothetical protein